MKILAYDGVPPEVLGVGLSLYKRAKGMGRTQTITFERHTIRAEPSRIRLLIIAAKYPAPAVFNDITNVSGITDAIDGRIHYVHSFVGAETTSENTDPHKLVTGAGGATPIYAAVDFEIERTSATAYPNYTKAFEGVSDAEWVAHRDYMLNTAFDGFYDEQAYMIAHPDVRVFIDKDSVFYGYGVRTARLAGPCFMGTAAPPVDNNGAPILDDNGQPMPGDPVVVCRVLPIWADTNPSDVQLYPVPDDILTGDTQTLYYDEFYVAISTEDFHLTESGRRDYTDIRKGVTNVSGAELVGEILFTYELGYDTVPVSITQDFWESHKAEMSETDAWDFTDVAIEGGAVYPGSPVGYLWVKGAGYKFIDGLVAVSGVTIELYFDFVNILGVHVVHDAIALYSEPSYIFSTRNISDRFAFNRAIRAGRFTVTTGTEDIVSNLIFDIDTLGYAWNRACYYDKTVISSLYGSYVAVGTRFRDIGSPPISYGSSTDYIMRTLSRTQTTLTYENGALVVIPGPYATTPVGTNAYTYSYAKEWMESYVITTIYNPLLPTWTTATTITGAIYSPSPTTFYADGATYRYNAPYTQAQSITHLYNYDYDLSASPSTIITASTTGPIVENLKARPWWHQSPTSRINARFAVRNADTYITVHGYDDNTGVDPAELYVDGVLIYKGDPAGENSFPASIREGTRDMVPYGQHVEYTAFDAAYSAVEEGTIINNPPGGSGYTPKQDFGTTTVTGSSTTTDYMAEDSTIYLSGLSSPVEDIRVSPEIAPFLASMPYPLERRMDVITSNAYYDEYYWPVAVDPNTYEDLYTREGYTLFPSVWGSPRGVTIIHLKRKNYDTDGLCICSYSMLGSEFRALQVSYLQATDDAVRDSLFDQMVVAINVLYNNFASPELMVMTAPGMRHTMYNDQP